MSEQEYLTVKEAADIARVHPMTISEALWDSSLHGFQRGKHHPWRIKPECLRSWIEGRVCADSFGVAA